MASLTNYNTMKYRYLGQEEEILAKETDTLRGRILKSYLQKQLKTDRSLAECRQNQKEFQRAFFELNIGAVGEGLKSLEDFKAFEDIASIKQILRASGLSEKEINLLLDEGTDSNLLAPEVQEKWLRIIDKKLENHQLQLHSLVKDQEDHYGSGPPSHQNFEDVVYVIPTKNEGKKPTTTLTHSYECIPPGHPINHIKEIAEELFPLGSMSSERFLQPKKREYGLAFTKEYRNEPVESRFKHAYLSKKPKTYWDLKEIPKIVGNYEGSGKSGSIHEVSGKGDWRDKLNIEKQERVVKHDPSQSFVFTLDRQELIPLDHIKSNRKTFEELKEIDKFKNFKLGNLSKTVYIKNLSHKSTPYDLASLFGNFEPETGPKICYRILNGRMRGQAFVTFQDEKVAERVLEMCNGYILHGKPIVMEFSKH